MVHHRHFGKHAPFDDAFRLYVSHPIDACTCANHHQYHAGEIFHQCTPRNYVERRRYTGVLARFGSNDDFALVVIGLSARRLGRQKLKTQCEQFTCIVVKEFLQLMRDKRQRMMLIIAPLMQLLLLGYAATTDNKHRPCGMRRG